MTTQGQDDGQDDGQGQPPPDPAELGRRLLDGRSEREQQTTARIYRRLQAGEPLEDLEGDFEVLARSLGGRRPPPDGRRPLPGRAGSGQPFNPRT